MGNVYFDMGFRTHQTLPSDYTASESADMVTITSPLKGGNAYVMAKFLITALAAVEREGYTINYASGPANEFGLIVTPNTHAPDPDPLSESYAKWCNDYAVLCELGTIEELRARIDDTLKTATVPHQRSQADHEDEWDSLPGVTDTYPSTAISDNVEEFHG